MIVIALAVFSCINLMSSLDDAYKERKRVNVWPLLFSVVQWSWERIYSSGGGLPCTVFEISRREKLWWYYCVRCRVEVLVPSGVVLKYSRPSTYRFFIYL